MPVISKSTQVNLFERREEFELLGSLSRDVTLEIELFLQFLFAALTNLLKPIKCRLCLSIARQLQLS
jgi:hypothetical protein